MVGQKKQRIFGYAIFLFFKLPQMKNRVLLIAVLFALSIPSSAIAGNRLKKIMDSWMGATKHSLILSWGPPSRTASDGDGGEVLVYAYSGYSNSIPLLDGQYLPAQSWYDYRIFYVSSEGKIYSWRTSREMVPPTQVDLTIYHR